MVKAILGYDIMPGVTFDEFEKWFREIHIPDLSTIPGVKKFVINTVKDIVREDVPARFFRIAELHYDSMESYEKAKKWREKHPFPVERSPQGKTDFKFYLVCETEEISFEK